MIVRLDPGVDLPSAVVISNFVFARLELVPEPSSFIITELAMFMLCCCRGFGIAKCRIRNNLMGLRNRSEYVSL